MKQIMDSRTQAKVHELVDTLAATLKIECERLYNSGGIDVNEFDLDRYLLAKVLVTVAMHQRADDFAPTLNKKLAALIKNLREF